MSANRAAEFAALAAAAQTPSYRRLWTSQADYYAEQDDAGQAHAEQGNGQPVHVGNSELSTPAFRLASESAWAALFDALAIRWEYNVRPSTSSGCNFWLCERRAWVKVLSQPPTKREFWAARELTAWGHRVYIVSGWPRRKGYGVWVFAETGEVVAVRADFRDLALANLLGVSFGRLYEAFEVAKSGR